MQDTTSGQVKAPGAPHDGRGVSRRAFLLTAGLAAGGAAVSAAGTPRPAQPADPGAAVGRGYRETEHVRRVYALSRF